MGGDGRDVVGLLLLGNGWEETLGVWIFAFALIYVCLRFAGGILLKYMEC